MFLGFRPHSHDSVASCLGSKINNDILNVEHLCLPGVQPLFCLKTKQHNLNVRSIIQRKKNNSGIIFKNFEHCQEHNMLIFRAQSTKAYNVPEKMAKYNVEMWYIQGKTNVIYCWRPFQSLLHGTSWRRPRRNPSWSQIRWNMKPNKPGQPAIWKMSFPEGGLSIQTNAFQT